MINDLDDMFVVLEKFDITMEQFMLPYILYLDQREHGENPLPRGDNAVAYIYRYSENIRPWPRASIQELVEKGLLKNYNEDESVYPDQLEVTDKFAEAVFATQSDFETFWDSYPAFIDNFNDERKGDIPLKASVKDNVQQLFEDMITSKREFKEMMEALTWAKKHDMIRMNIEKFLGSEYWKQLREKMDEPPDTGVTVI
jgi:hypothetical protein